MGIADHRRFGDVGVRDERGFDFRRAHAVARDIDDIVDPAGDPVIIVGIALAAVTGKIFALIGAEIGLDEPFMVAIDAARLSRPAGCDAQIAVGRAIENLTFAIDQLWLDAEKRFARATRFHAMGAGQGGDHDAAGFGLPPGIDNR